jgi:hypothetical protein
MTVSLTKAPRIELRDIKHTAWASEETHCYQATLYVDGEKWGIVANQGHGGCDSFYGEGGRTRKDTEALNALIGETFPAYTCGDTCGDSTLTQDLEMVCADLVNQWLRDKDFARAMKTKVLFTKPDVQGVWEVAVKKPQTAGSLLTIMKIKYPDYTYLAELPVAQAKAIYFGE